MVIYLVTDFNKKGHEIIIYKDKEQAMKHYSHLDNGTIEETDDKILQLL